MIEVQLKVYLYGPDDTTVDEVIDRLCAVEYPEATMVIVEQSREAAA